jgi:hypothetical protein
MKQELRSCYPRDIVNQVCWAARYEGRNPYIDRAALKQASMHTSSRNPKTRAPRISKLLK